LLSKWPAPCDYAARANPEGFAFTFAFSLIDQLRSHPVNSTFTFTPVDPISAPSKIHWLDLNQLQT